MIKKSFIFLLLFLLLPCCAQQGVDKGGHAGTPPGFYDDITEQDIENEEFNEHESTNFNGSQNINIYQQDYDGAFQHYSVDEIIIPEKNKPTKNYSQIYRDLKVPDFSYLHNIDPEQYYDMKDTSWSVYPLLRLISPIYFKNITIEPGYYLLTPREHDGEWFILFKQNGIVKHIIPVYERDYTPMNFYDEHIPKPKLTKSQKIHMGFLDFLGKFDSTKRKEPVESFLELHDVENHLVTIIIYYGGHKYSTLFRTVRL